MKKFILMLLVCAAMACKKDSDKTLTSKNWVIESATVTPAITINNKTSNNYIELMGQSSCVANMMISFSSDGTYSSSSNGALCDMAVNTGIKTWSRSGDQITLSATKDFPMILSGNKLTQTVSTSPTAGIAYIFTYVYKAQSK